MVILQSECRARLLASIVFVVRCSQYQGGDPQFIAGALALAENRALGEGLDWPAMLADAREALGADVGRLIDAALVLVDGRTTEND